MVAGAASGEAEVSSEAGGGRLLLPELPVPFLHMLCLQVDTPLAPYFSDNLTSEDLDEMNIEVSLMGGWVGGLQQGARWADVCWAGQSWAAALPAELLCRPNKQVLRSTLHKACF